MSAQNPPRRLTRSGAEALVWACPAGAAHIARRAAKRRSPLARTPGRLPARVVRALDAGGAR